MQFTYYLTQLMVVWFYVFDLWLDLIILKNIDKKKYRTVLDIKNMIWDKHPEKT